jgi:hypothetical protein
MPSTALGDAFVGFNDIDYPFRMLISPFHSRDLVHTLVISHSSS